MKNLSVLNLPFSIVDSYISPVNNRRPLLDRLFPKSGFWFYLKYLGIVIKQRRNALKGAYDDEAWASSSMDIFRVIEKSGGRFNIQGLGNLDKLDGPVVFVSNHMGTLETMVFPFLIAPKVRVTFVVKESIVTNKIFGPIMRSRDPITVGRNNSRDDLIKVLAEGKKRLDDGISVIIFPQSTRQRDFYPDKFNTLGSKLASKSGVKIIPIAIKTDFWGNGKRMKELGPINRDKTIYMNFGIPISIEGNGKDAHQEVIKHISSNLNKYQLADKPN